MAIDGAICRNVGAGSQQSEIHDGVSNCFEVQGNDPAAVSVAMSGNSSKWGPAPSSEVADDFQAAKMAAIRAAEVGK